MKKYIYSSVISAAIISVAACSSDSKNIADKVPTLPPITSLSLDFVGSHVSDSEFGTSAAEIVSYDKISDRLYVINASDASVDVLALAAGNSLPSKVSTIDLAAAATDAGITIGAANSVVAKDGLVAVAIENSNKQGDGIIALYRSSDLALLNTYSAGALPDMVTMTDDARYIIAANEGEPSADYSVDPEGTVTIIDLQNGTGDAEAVVTQVRFNAFNTGQSRAAEIGSDVRLTKPNGATVAEDLEPEYIAISEDGKAYVALQENNAFAIIDIATKSVDKIVGLGEKSWASLSDGGMGYTLDVSNKDDVFTRASYPQLVGLYMPDSIASFRINGEDYIISANEGDGREYIYESTQATCDTASHTWDGKEYQPGGEDEDATKYTSKLDDCIAHIDEARGEDLSVNAAHPLMNASVYGTATIADGDAIGRIKVIFDSPTVAANETVKTFGARSFSIWDKDANLVFDSGDQLSEIANNSTNWNVSNDTQENDNRSDDKGVEPEAIEIAKINGSTIAFIGLERQGGVAVYDVSKPSAPVFLDYKNNRNFNVDVCTEVDDGECDNGIYNTQAGDLGPESIEYFARENKHFIAVGNEVSGTTSVFELKINQ